ncbi:CHAT domain-containing protein [Mycena capillaripes]|nr:CHAT domain-containing protein [Mycena capillaripes]
MDLQELDTEIELHRETLTLLAPLHPDRGKSLNDLGLALWRRFGQQGDLRDIDEAIELHREALTLHEPLHPDRGMSLSNLANTVMTKFEQEGNMQDLDEAIELHREALVLREPPHPDCGSSLKDLALAVMTRFEQQGNTQDLDEVIQLYREVLALHEPPHPNHGSSLNNLANAIMMRFQQQGNTQDLDEVIQLYREVLALHGPPHPNRGSSLNNLVHAVMTRFEQQKNLVHAVMTRFEQQRDTRDIDEVIELHREALTFCKPPHPNRGSSLHGLARCFAFRYEWTHESHDLDSACDLFQEAVTYPSSALLTRFHHAQSWAKTVIRYRPTSSLAAYHTAIELLFQLAALHLDLLSRQKILSTKTVSTLASDIATCAVGLGQYNTAVELLEASRSIFWSQPLYLRTPLDNLATISPWLSAKTKNLSRQLELAAFQDTSRDILDTQQKILSIESDSARCRQLNEEWEETVKEVQKLPGFKDFMQPKAMAALQQAAVSGPIVILTTTNSTCFALIVTLSSDVQYLKLPGFLLPEAHLLSDLSRGLSNPAFDFETFVETCEPEDQRSELKARLFAGEGTLNVHPDDVFRQLLADLWKNIVKPVFETLKLQKSDDPRRLWWCPTGPFAFLPIHAAGIYDKDMTDCVSDYVISSYTPTLTALLDPPPVTATLLKMTAVIEPKAPDCSPLPGARAELQKIMARVPSECLTGLVNTTVETALIHLRQSSIVHFACHGVQDLVQPLDSGLILSDGRLKVSEIMRRSEGEDALDIRKSMSLAFLSACETSKGDETVPDEAMHPAATLLFAGFRGVVATMWTMNYLDGPKIADTFYEHLFQNCDPNSDPPVLPDLTQAAKALHLSVAKLRKEPDTPFRRWVPFVHYGL